MCHLGRRADDLPTQVFALSHLGNTLREQGDLDAAREHSTASVALARQLNDPWHLAMALNNQGFNAFQAGDLSASVEDILGESLHLRRQLGEQRGIAVTLSSLAELHLAQRRWQQAETELQETKTLAAELQHGEILCVADNLLGLLHTQRPHADLDQASTFLLAAFQRSAALGYPPSPPKP